MFKHIYFQCLSCALLYNCLSFSFSFFEFGNRLNNNANILRIGDLQELLNHRAIRITVKDLISSLYTTAYIILFTIIRLQ